MLTEQVRHVLILFVVCLLSTLGRCCVLCFSFFSFASNWTNVYDLKHGQVWTVLVDQLCGYFVSLTGRFHLRVWFWHQSQVDHIIGSNVFSWVWNASVENSEIMIRILFRQEVHIDNPLLLVESHQRAKSWNDVIHKEASLSLIKLRVIYVDSHY